MPQAVHLLWYACVFSAKMSNFDAMLRWLSVLRNLQATTVLYLSSFALLLMRGTIAQSL
jgi:hypothetical protein